MTSDSSQNQVLNGSSLLKRLARWAGLDRAIFYTVFARGWSSLAGIVTLILITRYLSAGEQGYYYTFYSLVAIQIIFELGFSVVIQQFASHEAAHLTISPDGHIEGEAQHHARLASVLHKAVRWYTIAAVLMATVLLPVGIYFFTRQTAAHPLAQPVHWIGPWLLVVLSTMCTFQLDPSFSFLEGCGYVPEVARTRLGQAILGSSLAWVALVLHHGLYAPGCIILGQAVAGGIYLHSRRGLLLRLLRHPAGDHKISWNSEIWPFQWRIAVSWLAGYFTFQLFNPILFAYRGPVEAGQMGMALNICNALIAITIAWVNTKSAPFGRMIALREFKQLDSVFFRALLQTLLIALTVAGGIWCTMYVLRLHRVPFALRVLPPVAFGMLLSATVLNIVVYCYAIYLRAHKQEKFMVNSVVGALYVAPAAFLVGRSYGATGIAAAYLLGSVVIGLGFGTYTFLHWRKVWHG